MAYHIHFTEHLALGGFNYAYGISAFDLTGSGSLDLVTADTVVGLYWLENDGHGNFARHIIHERTDEWLERHAVADINGDGRPEIVIVDNLNGSLRYFAFTGDPRDRQAWTLHTICEGTLPGAYDVAVADFDGDGDLDIAASSWRKGNQFAWFENPGLSGDGVWVQHLIEAEIGETRTICAVDMNGDGRVDLLGTASAGNQVVWYENPGDPIHQPWRKHWIDSPQRPIHGHPVDMDGDGDVDVVLALGHSGPGLLPDPGDHQVVWYENLGSATAPGPWQRHLICDSFIQGFEAVAADLDGDGQMEVVATAWGPTGQIALFSHAGDPRGPWSKQLLKENWANANTVFIADLDGDGRLDIVAAAERGSNEVRWWRNEGPENHKKIR
jgi:hypothetical protein